MIGNLKKAFFSWLAKQGFSFFLLIFGLIVTIASTMVLLDIGQNKELATFEQHVNDEQRLLEIELANYFHFFLATKGLWESQTEITASEFSLYTNSIDLFERAPGLNLIGIVDQVNNEYSWRYYQTKNTQHDFNQDFWTNLHTTAILTSNQPNQNIYISQPLQLPVSNASLPGLIMLSRLSNKQSEPKNVYLVGVLSTNSLFSSSLDSLNQLGVDLSITDQASSQPVFFKSKTFPFEAQLHLNAKHSLQVANRTWITNYTTNYLFSPSFERILFPLYLLAGLATTLLLFIISRLHLRAVIKVERATSLLQTSRAQLRQSQVQYKTLTENANDLITLIDLQGNILYASPSHWPTLGWSEQYLENNNLLNLVYPQDKKIIQNLLFSCQKTDLSADKNSAKITFRIQNKQKEMLVLESSYSPLLDDQQKPQNVLIISRDVTARQALEKRKDEFISIASHELKTPISSLRVYTQFLREVLATQSDQSIYKVVGKMEDQLNKLIKLIHDLLDVSKLENNGIFLQYQKFDLNQAVEEVVADLQLTSPQHEILIESGNPLWVEADPDRISQVISNLIANALKFSPQNEPVIVSVEQDSNKAFVRVIDFGPGIDSQEKEKIFSRFYQVQISQQSLGGFGLGLYICQQIILLHKGKIWVEDHLNNNINTGSQFIFYIPLKKMV